MKIIKVKRKDTKTKYKLTISDSSNTVFWRISVKRILAVKEKYMFTSIDRADWLIMLFAATFIWDHNVTSKNSVGFCNRYAQKFVYPSIKAKNDRNK